MREGADFSLLNAGIEISVRLDRPQYDYRDYLDVESYVVGKRYLDESTLARGGYSLRLRKYVNAGDYSFLDQELFAQVSRFLPSNTTVVLRSELAVKTYVTDPDTTSTGANVVPARSGRGRSLMQAIMRLKLAQSLGPSTGLQLAYSRRDNLAGQSRYANLELYNPDDDLFDDHYSYSGGELRATLKHLAPWGAQVEASAATENRRFAGRPALDLDGLAAASGTNRNDRRKRMRLTAEKSLFPSVPLYQEVTVRLEWLIGENDSNDPYFDTRYQVISTGVQVDF